MENTKKNTFLSKIILYKLEQIKELKKREEEFSPQKLDQVLDKEFHYIMSNKTDLSSTSFSLWGYYQVLETLFIDLCTHKKIFVKENLNYADIIKRLV